MGEWKTSRLMLVAFSFSSFITIPAVAFGCILYPKEAGVGIAAGVLIVGLVTFGVPFAFWLMDKM